MASSDAAFSNRIHRSIPALKVLCLAGEPLTNDEAILLNGSNSNDSHLAIWRLKLEPQADDVVLEDSTTATADKAVALNTLLKNNPAYSKRSLFGSSSSIGAKDAHASFGMGLEEFGITDEMMQVNILQDQTWSDLSLDLLLKPDGKREKPHGPS
ncbi:hypothetical protein HDU79_010982 [Rhizoclosmatium sp. JEL0117]|nr:hypothetical protein HDU79_010982 [Rhizoclosmatium sp. JEL0117]